VNVSELFVVNGVCGGTVFFLPDVPTVLGRSPECHVQIADPWISSMHAMFERRGAELWVVDLDSRNGTFVDDERVHEAPVAPGSRLRFGKTNAEVRAQQQAQEPQALLSDQRTIIRYIADLAAELPRSASGPDVEGAVAAAAAAAAVPRRDTVRGPAGTTGVARRQIAVLNEVARTVSAAASLEDALGALLRVLAPSLGAERSSVLLMDEHGDMMPVVAEPLDMPPRLSATVVQATLRSRAGILTLDAQQDQRFAASASVIAQGIRSCISAPIWADNRILGVVLLERGFADPFNADDLELATLVGFQAALAVERVRMAERTRASEEQRALLVRYLDPAVAASLLSPDADRDALEPSLRSDLGALAVTVSGADALAGARGALEAAQRAAALQRALAAAAQAEGAAVDARLDGGLLAVFGLPRAQPDAAVRALRCAAALASRAVALEEPYTPPRLSVKVGVEVGQALAGNFGSAEHPELRASGVAVDAAVRLAGEAQPGEVLCGPAAAAAGSGAAALQPVPRGGAFRLR
jgi:class 3 adenylate cyclase